MQPAHTERRTEPDCHLNNWLIGLRFHRAKATESMSAMHHQMVTFAHNESFGFTIVSFYLVCIKIVQ